MVAKKSRRVAIYVRVSTEEQTVEPQRLQLHDYCQRAGWTEVVEFTDAACSGAKKSRPGLDALSQAVRARKVDVVLVAAFDRFARSVSHLVNALDEFQHLGIDFISLRENVDTASPMGRMIFTIFAAGMSESRRPTTGGLGAGTSVATLWLDPWRACHALVPKVREGDQCGAAGDPA